MAGRVAASPTIEFLTGQITGPVEPGKPHAPYGWEFGPALAMPLPKADIGDAELGIRAGMTANLVLAPQVAVGFDFAYHYWPVSEQFKSDFNVLLRNGTLNTLELGGTTWRLRALSTSAHVKLLVPLTGRVRPWLQLGVGVYRIDPNTTGFSGDAGFFQVRVSPMRKFTPIGINGTLGVDFPAGPRMRLGLHAGWDQVYCRPTLGTELNAITVGSHLLFGKQ